MYKRQALQAGDSLISKQDNPTTFAHWIVVNNNVVTPIVGANITNDTIDSQHYAAASIDLEHMSANSIDSDQYVDGSIDLAHLSANSVDSDQYVDASIDTAHIGNLQVTTALIAADAIDGTKIADNAIDSEHYTDGSIDNAHLADDAVGVAELSASGTASNTTCLLYTSPSPRD